MKRRREEEEEKCSTFSRLECPGGTVIEATDIDQLLDSVFLNNDLMMCIFKYCCQFDAKVDKCDCNHSKQMESILKTVYAFSQISKKIATIYSKNFLIVCGNLGIYDALDWFKICPIKIDTLSDMTPNNPVKNAYKKIDSYLFDDYKDESTLHLKLSMSTFMYESFSMIVGGFASTSYLTLKHSEKVPSSFNYNNYNENCDFDIYAMSGDLSNINVLSSIIDQKQNKKFSYERLNPNAIEMVNGDSIEEYSSDDSWSGGPKYSHWNYPNEYSGLNKKIEFNYALENLYKIYKNEPIAINDDNDNDGSTRNHIIDLKLIKCKYEPKDVSNRISIIFNSFDLTCSCFAFVRRLSQSDIEEANENNKSSNNDNIIVDVYTTPYNLYSILSGGMHFTNMKEEVEQIRVDKYIERGWNFKPTTTTEDTYNEHKHITFDIN